MPKQIYILENQGKGLVENCKVQKIEDTTVVPEPVVIPTLQQVNEQGNVSNLDIVFQSNAGVAFPNGSRFQKGTVNNGYGSGNSRICVADKEDQWENGVRYLRTLNGTNVYAETMDNIVPNEYYDDIRGWTVDSVYKNLVTGNEYVCTDATTENAVWELRTVDLATKVDKVTGKSLILDTEISRLASVTNFDNSTNVSNIDAEITARIAGDASTILTLKDGVTTDGDSLQKLYNLIQLRAIQRSVVTIAERNALSVTVGTYVFVENDGDGNWAQYRATSVGVNANYIKISDPDLLNAVMSNAQIKTAYLSNAGTEEFTTVLLSKLNGIANGATANQTDAFLLNLANATGSLTAVQISNFASAVDARITGKEDSANKNQNNGYSGLDSGGKIPLANLPTTLLKYQGVWNALTNTPTLTSPDLTKVGNVYNVSVVGTRFGLTFNLGDWLIYNASGIPEKSDNSDDVVSVNGQTGVVTLTKSNVGLSNVDNTSDVNKPISTATQTGLDTKLNIANNLSDIANAKTARVNIGVDKRTTFGNVNYSALITDKEIVTSAAFTAPRTVTLIDGVNAGAEIIVADEFQTVTSVNTLTIAVPTGKSLNGILNGIEVIRAVGGWRRFLCDGNGNYFYDANVARLSGATFTGDISAPNISTPTGNVQTQINTKQNTLTNPLTGLGSNLDPTTYALQDGTILYHSTKWFTPTGTVSVVGTTVTSVGVQFTSAMIGSKLTINGEWRLITAFTSTSVVTVASAYSVNYSGISVSNWGVFAKSMSFASSDNPSYSGGFTLYNNLGQMIIRPAFDRIEIGARIADTLNNSAIFPSSTDPVQLAGDRNIVWRSGLSSANNALNTTNDLALRRNAAGVLEIYNGITSDGAVGNRRDLTVRNLTKSGTETIITAPTTSAGTFELITRNTSTGVVEKIASTILTNKVDAGVNNATTVVLSSATLNSTYPSASTGFRVYCTSIIAGAMVYEKTPTQWVGMTVTIP